MSIRSIHPFPARMASEVAHQVIKELPAGSTILDPMVGSGTVLKVALESGHIGKGFDLDPLAILLARVQTRHIEKKKLQEAGEQLLSEAKKLVPDEIYLPWIDDDEETKKFIEFWYDKPQIHSLRVLSYLLQKKKSPISDTLRVALSRLIITKNRGASLAGDVSHSRPHKIRDKNDFDVFQEFQKSCAWVAQRISEVPVHSSSQVMHGDARNMSSIADASIDAVVSSPPYLNAIDYLRGHKMSLVWFGHSISKLRNIRAESVGASKRPQAGSNMEIAKDLAKKCNLAKLPSNIQHTVYRYALDIDKFVCEAERVVKPGGQIVYVVGNSRIKGILVKNTEIIIAAAKKYGLKLDSKSERDIPASRRYLPPPKSGSTSPMQKRMGVETVLTFIK